VSNGKVSDVSKERKIKEQQSLETSLTVYQSAMSNVTEELNLQNGINKRIWDWAKGVEWNKRASVSPL